MKKSTNTEIEGNLYDELEEIKFFTIPNESTPVSVTAICTEILSILCC